MISAVKIISPETITLLLVLLDFKTLALVLLFKLPDTGI